MSELDIFSFDEVPSMESLLETTSKDKNNNFTPGTILKGIIIEKRDNGVLIDIGFKAEGFIGKEEFLADWEKIEKGQETEVLLEKIENKNNMPVISRSKAVAQNAWERITQKYKVDDIIKGFVKLRIKGGLIVDICGVDCFLPGSLVDINPIKNLDAFLEQEYDFKIIGISMENKNIILSRKALLKDEKEMKKKEMLKTLKVGDLCKGFVKNITDFGVFVDVDGVDALLHITDMSWGRITNPSEIVSNGEEIEVVIIKIDKEKNQIGLGLKQKTVNPWENFEDRYKVDSHVKGKVVNIMNYGAFVELEQGIEGLIHVSEMSWLKHITRPNDILSVGQEVEAVILSVSLENRKISLGIRQLTKNPWEAIEEEFPVGSKIKGEIHNLTSYGIFIKVNSDIDGMIHCSDIFWTRKVGKLEEIFQKGQEVEAIVLGIDVKNRRVSLGIKQLNRDPWENIDDLFKVGDEIKCVVNKLASYGVFVQLSNDIDGLIHITRLSDEKIEKVSDVVTVGQKIKATIIKIDVDERRIYLSFRKNDVNIKMVTKKNKLGQMGEIFDNVLDGLDASKEEKK